MGVNKSLDNENMYQNSIGRRFFVTCIASYKSHDSLPLFHTSNANFYTVLEIEKDASTAQVKNVYFEKSKELHPDKNDSEEAKQNYKDVREAYDILGDKRKRRVYDNLLSKQEYRENIENDSYKQSNFKGGTRWENMSYGSSKFYRRTRVDDLNEEYSSYSFKRKRNHQNYDDAKYHRESEFSWDFDESDCDNKKKDYSFYNKEDPAHPESKDFKDFEEKPLDFHRWSKIMTFSFLYLCVSLFFLDLKEIVESTETDQSELSKNNVESFDKKKS